MTKTQALIDEVLRLDAPERFWRRVDKGAPGGCWNWTGPTLRGYGRFHFEGKTWLAHRFSLSRLSQPPPNKPSCCHKCDNASCVNPDHLYWGTQKDNLHDCVSKGRHWSQKNPGLAAERIKRSRKNQVGVKHHQTKISPEVAVEMLRLHRSGRTFAEIGRHYGVTDTAVSYMAKGRTVIGKQAIAEIERIAGEDT